MQTTIIIPPEKIDRAILFVRGHKVMLDQDLAEIYGVETKRLNEQVKRNLDRFPEDFMFQLTSEEKQQVVDGCEHLEKLKYSPTSPYAFTEHGALMLSAVLNSPIAIEASVQIVRAFVKLRDLLLSNEALALKLAELEANYSDNFTEIYQILRHLIDQKENEEPRTLIGYKMVLEA